MRIRIHVVDLFDFSPEDLAGFEKATGVDAWYFFTRTDVSWVEKVARDGIWKATGDEAIKQHGQEIGYKKETVFFRGENGVETDWLMSEFRLKKAVQAAENNTRLEDWVLFKLSKKIGA